jgi:hypothetical protein
MPRRPSVSSFARAHAFWVAPTALGLVVSYAVAACSVGDQSCSPAYNPQDLSDGCPYGPPGGPQLSAPPDEACPLVEGPLPDDDCDNIGWTEDVWPRLRTEPDPAAGVTNVGACAAVGCHAPPAGAKGVTLPYADASGAFEALAGYTGQLAPRAYIDTMQPNRSWIVCNLRGDVGIPMPYLSTINDDDVALTERWVRCGIPLTRKTMP